MAKKKISGSPAPVDIAAESTVAPAPRRRRAAAPKAEPQAEQLADLAAPVANPSHGNGRTQPTPTYDQIAEAAYHRYLKRGGGDGRDFDDWLEAEQELKAR